MTAVLVEAARDGDDDARDALLGEVRRAVLRYAVARGTPRPDAEDLAQEVCMAVLTVLPRWQDDGRPVWAFVFRVLRNKLVDRARDAARTVDLDPGHLGGTDPAPGPEALALIGEGNARMRDLLSRLPATQRDVLLLRAVVGLDTAETARALGLARGSVHVLQHRAVRFLRARLAEVTP